MTEKIFTDAPPRRKPFVILCYPRTGSYLLVDLLSQFPEIACHGEIFKGNHVELPPAIKDKVGYDVEKRNQDPFGYIRKIVATEGDKHTGFKIFPSHCKEAYNWCVASAEINRVALWRSPFEVYVSLKRATTRGKWTDRSGQSKNDSKKLVFDSDVFDRNIRLFSNQNRNLRKLAEADPMSTILINYKQVTDPEAVREVAKFLGVTVQPEKLEYRLHKQTTERYSELFENFEELMNHVKANHPKIQIDPEKI